MANSYLSHTQSSGNRTNWTLSAWVKRSELSTTQYIMANYSGSDYCYLQINSNNKMRFLDYNSGNNCNKITTRLFRDTSAWYHVVIAIDTTDATAEDRFKLYINGVRETAFDTSANFSSSFNTNMNASGYTSVFGVNQQGNASYWNGYMSHVSLVDGATLAPTTFGQTDSTSGIWKFKSPTGVTWGTNGVHLKFENSGAMGTDSSGQSNTYTVNGNLKQALDTPSNVHATFNPLALWNHNGTLRIPAYSNGNLTAGYDNSSYNEVAFGNLGVNKGKWYWEVKATNVTDASGNTRIGIGDIQYTDTDPQNTTSTVYYQGNGQKRVSGSASSYGATYTGGNIIGVAMDLDNNKLYFHKDGVYQNSGVPTSGSTGTGAIAIPTGDYVYTIQCEDYASSGTRVMDLNTGSGFFGTTAITSAGSNGNGSLFEYDVPSGYYALNTKNINTYG